MSFIVYLYILDFIFYLSYDKHSNKNEATLMILSIIEKNSNHETGYFFHQQSIFKEQMN